MSWTAILIAGVVVIMIAGIVKGAPAPLEDDETTWP